ncbi:MAG: 4,5-DOPA dioxygenase extradiol [Phenylobacterium sp.]|uniref:4,5-DOPA-extradiol-dioxygenase n=1 Tax=Phenylobacterium sp. TaxID=1871053 RepID=UPI002727F6CC|nr:4,5-DOPA dioxygenase extradiol [Phenylobacterium sp.]MDO8411868.1 4,5-DOPA dioxygenase extradiol [Phenylobacterium sp.]
MSAPAERLPVVFFGHGSPMIAIETNDTTAAWNAIGASIGKPEAILCVSAHWLTRGVAVTAMTQPRTIHDFGASFPQALFNVQYPAPGDPALARRVAELLAPLPVVQDEGWGLDHGTWSVLCKAYPKADVPVVQLSMDASKPPAWHYEMGRKLAPLRDEGVLIVATGNIVHNLPAMDWGARHRPAFDWAAAFNDHIKTAIAKDEPQAAVAYEAFGEAASRSVPTPDHYWPLLYALGARLPGDRAVFGPDHIEHGSLSMTTVMLDSRPAAQAA